MLTAQAAKKSEIGEIFKNHDSLFLSAKSYETNILFVYLIYERLKGKESFFHPFFDSVSQSDLPYFWDDKTLDSLLPTEFKTNLMIERAKIGEEFDTYSKIIQVYP
jgi:hypothetical protein